MKMPLRHFNTGTNPRMDQIIPIDYRALVDNMTTCILLIDRDLNIYYLNSACEALFDVSLFRASGTSVLNILQNPTDEFNTEEALNNTLTTALYTPRSHYSGQL